MAAGWLVARDELWEIVEPLISSVQAASTGRPRVPDRTARSRYWALQYVAGVTQLLGYARVSTADQAPQLQLDELAAVGCVRIWTDYATGTRA